MNESLVVDNLGHNALFQMLQLELKHVYIVVHTSLEVSTA